MSNTISVYKSKRNPDMYLYVTNKHDFSRVPGKLLKKFGEPLFVLQFDISQRTKLGRENPVLVARNIKTQGYHLQLPQIELPLNIKSKPH